MWSPARLDSRGPRFLAIVRALERDVADGTLAPGDRLRPQRDLAYRLGLSVGTVVRAYLVAEQRGLVIGVVGRGTFVAGPQRNGTDDFFGDGAQPPDMQQPAMIDLSLNVSPVGRQAELVGSALRSIGGSSELGELLRYSPHAGLPRHRAIMAEWISACTAKQLYPDPERMVICNGAQHAMATVLGTLTRPGDTVLTESLSYAGINAIAAHRRLVLHGLAMDAEGLVPEALDAACERTGTRVLYTIPTLQNPTSVTMSRRRREVIAVIAKRRRLWIVEDDVYGFLLPDAPPPFATLLPEQTYYLTGFSKSLVPGLRIGCAVAPATSVEGLICGIRASNWMTPPILSEIVVRWIANGTAASLVNEKRAEAKARYSIARQICGPWLAPEADVPSFHAWLQLPEALPPEDFVLRARRRGVVVTPPDAVTIGVPSQRGIRVCLGAAHDQAQLQAGLWRLYGLLSKPTDDDPRSASVI